MFELAQIGRRRRRRQRDGTVGRYVRAVRVAGLALVPVQVLFRVLHQLLHLGHPALRLLVARLHEAVVVLQYFHGHHTLHVDPGRSVPNVAVRPVRRDVTVRGGSLQGPKTKKKKKFYKFDRICRELSFPTTRSITALLKVETVIHNNNTKRTMRKAVPLHSHGFSLILSPEIQRVA